MDETTSEKLESVYARYIEQEGNAVSILQDIQNEFGYIPEENVYWIANKTGIAASMFFGIVTFYTQFYMTPRGENIVTACCGTVCHVKGSQRIISRINNDLKLREGEDTTKDGLFTLEKVNCIGACSIAPVVVINKKVHGKMSPEKMAKQLKLCRDKKSE
jgi:NADH:ubiquinone oxidoreductase subunit E